MTSVTKAGTTYDYTYAGASQTEVLSQTTPNGTYKVAYGRTDAQGQPVIEQYKKDNLTAYVEHDPVTGEALMLRTSSGMQSLYVYDGTGNPAALVTSTPTIAFAYDYDPYGVPTLTTDSGGLGTTQNPYAFKAGIQDRVTGWVKYGQRWYNPSLGRWTQQDTLDAPLDPANANRYAYAANDPINNSDPLGLNAFGVILGTAIGTAVSAAGTAITCVAIPGLGCFIGAAGFGAVGGAIAGGIISASDGVTGRDAGPAVGLGALAGAIGGPVRKFVGDAFSKLFRP